MLLLCSLLTAGCVETMPAKPARKSDNCPRASVGFEMRPIVVQDEDNYEDFVTLEPDSTPEPLNNSYLFVLFSQQCGSAKM